MTKLSGKLNIGKLGAIDLSLPLLKLESGISGPKILFIANQHGGETTGILAIQELFEKLESNNFKGTIFVIPTANPLGLLFNTRNEPVEGKNLNRQFPGDFKGNLAKRMAAAIFELAKTMDLVVDLHCFSRNTPIMGIIVRSSDQTEIIAKKMLKVFNPEVVWKIDPQDQLDKRFTGALDIALVKKKVPAITIEMPRLNQITDDQLNKVIQGLFNVSVNFDLILESSGKSEEFNLPVFKANYIYSDYSGIFIPKKKLLEPVAKGEKIGQIIDVNNLKKTEVRSPKKGIVLTMGYKNFVRCGTKLASIGEAVKE